MTKGSTHQRLEEAINKNPKILDALPSGIYREAARLLFPEVNQNQNQK